ncbi:MAG: hypothetical protein HYY16_11200, partial [Planctomycetes bacterium]|nr:hypothetical protein [Planctomycetota bacterium]
PAPSAEPPADVSPPEPAQTPPPPPSLEPEIHATRVREPLPARLGAVKLTDLTGEIAIKRKGRDRKERVSGTIVVSSGDTLIAEHAASFFLEQHPIALMPQTHMGVAMEEGSSSPALFVDRGEALVDSSAVPSRWYVAAKDVGVWIENTDAKFAAKAEGPALGVTALSGHLAGRDDYGRPFDLRDGEKLMTSATSATTSPDPEVAQKAASLASACPATRTFFHVAFDLDTAKGLPITEGLLDRSGEFLAGTDRKGIVSAGLKLPQDLCFRGDLVVRMRVRTNLRESRVILMVEDKAQLVALHRVREDQRQKWLTVDFALDDSEVQLLAVSDVGGVITSRDRLVSLGATGRRQDVFGDERPYLHLDDVQLALRAP